MLTFSVYRVGDSFQNIPFSLNSNWRHTHQERKEVELVNTDGDSVCHIPSSKYNRLKEPDAFKEEKESFKFDCDSNEIIVALKLTDHSGKGRVVSYLLLLSEPMYVHEMQARRDAVVFRNRDEAANQRFKEIEMLWGK